MAMGLSMGMLLTGCDSGTSGNDGREQDGSYMTAMLDGKPWQTLEAFFFVNSPNDSTSPGSFLQGSGPNQNALGFSLVTDWPDSAAFETLFGKNHGELTLEGGNTFYTVSGYIKITRVSDSWVQGSFVCEMMATDDSAEPRKVVHLTDGKFLLKIVFMPSLKNSGR
jgi:hypothetical protein